jgi:citrate lyase subunit alpha/citrate CoA-transferase
MRLLIARYAAEIIERVAMQPGFSFQTGAGGISLAATKMLEEIMIKRGIKSSFVLGGVTQYTVEMLKKGLVDVIIDGQAFDLAAVKSLKEDGNHLAQSVFNYGNPHTGGGVANWLDACILGATEVDVSFNVNVNTHSDGYLLHGIGGHQDGAAGSALTIITAPLFRNRIPIIRDRVTTITTPGECIDAIVTERGIAINPKRDDILDKLKRSKLPIMDVQDLKKKAYDLCGKPEEPKLTDEIICGIQWLDGTLLDVVYGVDYK